MTAGSADKSGSKLLVLGSGAVVSEYYLPALAMMGRLDSVTVADLDATAISVLRQRFLEVRYICGDYEASLDSDGLDNTAAAVIALPNALHVMASRAALERGFHVLCEKPLALSLSDCQQLGRIAVENQRLLKVAMSRRYLPSLMAAKDLIETGEIGAPIRIEIVDRFPFSWRPRSFSFFEPKAGGILADMGSHYLDYLQNILGPLEPIAYEDDSRGGVESALTYELRAGDVRIHIRLSRMDGSGGEVLIECERGSIRIGKTEEAQIVVHPSAAGARPRRVTLKQPFTADHWPLNFHGSFCEMLSDFDRALRGEPSRIADVREAEGTSRLIEWAYERRNTTVRPRRPVRNGPGVDWLITGATGFIGGHLLDHLYSHKDGNIRVSTRSPASCSNISRYTVEIVPTELLDMQQVEAAVAGARVVFHLAYGRDGKNASQVTIQGTKNVVDAAIACGAEAVVVLSTMYVFGFPTDVEMVDEGCPYRPYGGEYGESKAKMERWCLSRAKKSSRTRVVVLNPTCVFGPRGGAYTTLPVELALQKRFCWIEGGFGLCNYTYVENLVDAVVLASENTKVNGERFIINDGSISWREFFEPFLKEMAPDLPTYTKAQLEQLWSDATSFSIGDLTRAVLASSEIRTVLKRSRLVRRAHTIARRSGLTSSISSVGDNFSSGVTQRVAAENLPPLWLAGLFGGSRVRFSAKHAREILGWSPRISLDVGRERTLQWLRESGFYQAEHS